ncbi:MAG: hypothetical protein R3C44_07420 [Chloroflexota bacterium]
MELIDNLQLVVMTTTVVAYSLYTFLAEGVPENHVMMLTIPFVVYGVFRYLYLIQIRERVGPLKKSCCAIEPCKLTLFFMALSRLWRCIY